MRFSIESIATWFNKAYLNLDYVGCFYLTYRPAIYRVASFFPAARHKNVLLITAQTLSSFEERVKSLILVIVELLL